MAKFLDSLPPGFNPGPLECGLPPILIERAREILHNLEGSELDEAGRPRLAQAERSRTRTSSPEAAQRAGKAGGRAASQRRAEFGPSGERSSDGRPSGLETEADSPPGQLGLFGLAPAAGDLRAARVLEALRRVEPDHTTPIEALEILSRLVSELGPPQREREP